ncbi:hypothetical protein [Niabella ginsengisoli]|uniref:Uncharacterized protein n=1 Tax=Niabella ginsengisoli TaxID=522298 RepID=A0ABS9SL24_9BACT|nr:hypothetical protein [Niabella ginsengisoli]MCH5599079.1 hypothetical protein [Niabella ginsengisoli]
MPERKTLDFNLHDNILSIQSNANVNGNATSGNSEEARPVKYTNNLKSELPGIAAFFDYEEALAASKKRGNLFFWILRDTVV